MGGWRQCEEGAIYPSMFATNCSNYNLLGSHLVLQILQCRIHELIMLQKSKIGTNWEGDQETELYVWLKVFLNKVNKVIILYNLS